MVRSLWAAPRRFPPQCNHASPRYLSDGYGDDAGSCGSAAVCGGRRLRRLEPFARPLQQFVTRRCALRRLRERPRGRPRRAGAQGRRHLPGRSALCGRRPDLRPQDDPNYRAEGLASWYGDDFHGRFTANGEIFDKDGITAAHTTLPLPSYVRVTNLTNGKSLIVRVNDRG